MSSIIATHRVDTVMSHLPQQQQAQQVYSNPTRGTSPLSKKSPNDVVIVSALRTPIAKAKRGSLKDTYVEELLATVIRATFERVGNKIQPKEVGDIVVGTVLGNNSQRANECRMAGFLAGVPSNVPIHLVNRQCSSGLQALAHVAANISAGNYDVGLACGVESMSVNPMKWEGSLNPRVFLNKQAKDCLLPMGITSENVSRRFGVTRADQDEFSVASHKKAAEAIRSGKFKNEIVPVKTKVKDPKTGAERDIIFDTDEGVRGDTTFEGLSKLKPAFTKDGSTTAGSSSQVSDGAAAVLATKRSIAEKLGLPILGVFRAFSCVGVEPDVMGIGPAVAIPDLLKKAGLKPDDIDVYEVNEAFASQALYSIRKVGLPMDRVNPNGGAIALGHPLGCTGARQVSTLLNELHRRKARYGVTSMCIGSGMGAAALFEVEQ